MRTLQRSASTTWCLPAEETSSSCSSRAARSPAPLIQPSPRRSSWSRSEHFRFTLFLITLLGVLGLLAFALLSVRAKAFWARVRQGLTILTDRRRYLREVASWQAAAWVCRFTSFWFLLDAFRVGGSVVNVLLVFGVGQVAGAVPFTPGGAGVQQALLVKVFSSSAPTAVVAAYSVGQQIAIAAFTATAGLAAIVLIFRFRSFKEVIAAGRASRDAERESERDDDHEGRATAVPRGPRARV